MMRIKHIIQKYRPKLYTPAFYLMLAASAVCLYFIFEITPQSNDECLWREVEIAPDSSIIVFEKVKQDGVTWNAGIRDGDRLVAINGVDIKNPGSAQYILNNVASGDSAFYVYERNNESFETSVLVKKLISFSSLAVTLLALIWLVVGFVVIKAKPEGYTQLLFFRIGLLLVLFSSIAILNNNFGTNPLVQNKILIIVLIVIWIFATSLLPFVLVHFFWVFPQKFNFINKKYTAKILYAIPTVLFVILIVTWIYTLSVSQMLGNKYLNLIVSALFLLVVIACGIGLVSLYISYFRLKNKKEKRPIFVIVVSYSLGVLAIIYSNTLAGVIAGPIFNNPEFFVPVILIILLPLAFAYSVFKYSLMDVSHVVKNAVFYGIATASLAGIYFMLIYFVGQSVSYAIGTEYQAIIAGIIFIAFALMLQSTKDKFQEVITRRFYPEQFAFQKILLKFSNDIPTIVGLDNILKATHDIFVDALKLKKIGIFLSRDHQPVYHLIRSYGFDGTLDVIRDEKYLLKEKISEKKNLSKQPVIEQEEFKDIFPDQVEHLKNEHIYTLVPLIINMEVIGFFLLGLKYSGARFANKDLELLLATANQIAVSIENARLYASEAEKMKMDQELENARKIQESLLPQNIPQFPQLEICGTMIPAMQVGGDYYDIIEVSPTKVFIIVGDVSGKGLSASFYMSKLQTMIKLFCKENSSPKEVLIEINKRIYESIEKNWFITVSVGIFDLETKTLKYCRAGHSPLIIVGKDSIKEYQPKGIGVGLEKGEIFNSVIEEIEIAMTPEENYLFFSDGVSESMNENNKLYGTERLKNIVLANSKLSCGKILENTLGDIKNFRGQTPPNDDITLVIVKFKS